MLTRDMLPGSTHWERLVKSAYVLSPIPADRIRFMLRCTQVCPGLWKPPIPSVLLSITLGTLATVGSIYSTFKEPYTHQERILSFLYLVVKSIIFFQYSFQPQWNWSRAIGSVPWGCKGHRWSPVFLLCTPILCTIGVVFPLPLPLEGGEMANHGSFTREPEFLLGGRFCALQL